MRNAMIGLLILAYLSALAMSAGHLAQWYAKSLGGLPRGLAWGLAGSLEFTAFLLSLLSNSLLRGSSWAGTGAVLALGLVWVGNALSMHRGAPDLPLWEVLLMSLFVPVGTYVVGKVVGELLQYRPGTAQVPPLGTGLVPQAAPDTPLVAPAPPRAVPHPEPGTAGMAPERARVVPEAEPEVGPGGKAAVREPETAERATVRLRERSVDVEWSVEGKGAELLRVLARYRGPTTLTVLVRDLGWPKSTVRRWLDRLEEEGAVVRTDQGWALAREVDHV